MASVRFFRLPVGEGLEIPAYQTPGAAGMDLRASADVLLEPGDRDAVSTGFRVAIDEGFEGQVRVRSSLALKRGLIVPNAPGTIDSDYRGELKVLLANIGTETVCVERGERIAQLVIAPVQRVQVVEVDALDATERGQGGFGSTGRR